MDFSDIYATVEFDDTEFIQSLLDQNQTEIRIPPHPDGRPYIVRPLSVKNMENKHFIFEIGVEILAKKNEFHGINDSLFDVFDCKNITFSGYGATLRMRKKDYTKSDYKFSEWRHIFCLYRNTNLTIEGFRLLSSGGDAIILEDDRNYGVNKNVSLLNLTIEDNYRQGISVIAADTLTIEGCSIFATNGTAPRAGIDFEPVSSKVGFKNVLVRNCTFRYNKGSGILIYLSETKADETTIDITFENCTSKNNGLASFAVMQVPKNLKGTIRVINCDFLGFQYIRVPKTLIVTDKN